MKKKIIPISIIIVVLIGVGFAYKKRVQAVNDSRSPATKTVEAVRVKTQKVDVEEVKEFLFASGTIRAVNRHFLFFENKGKVIFLEKNNNGENLREGDSVKKGQILAKIDTRDLVQEISSIKANLKQLEFLLKQNISDLEKYQKLVKSDAIPKEQLEQKQLELNKTEADLAQTKATLSKTELLLEKSIITSPSDGVIAYINVKEGDFINGAPSFTNEDDLMKTVPFVVLEDDKMELTVDVPSGLAGRVKVGMDVLIYPFVVPPTVENKLSEMDDSEVDKRIQHMGSMIPAKVYSISPSVDPNSRSLQIKVRTTQDNNFRDGTSLSCQIITAMDNKNPVIPFNALYFENRVPYCFVVKDGRAKRVTIKQFGLITTEKASVVEGISVGDRLVVEGKHNLVDNSPVKEIK